MDSFASCTTEFSVAESSSLLPNVAGRRAPPPLDLSQITSMEPKTTGKVQPATIIKEGLYEFVSSNPEGASQGEDNQSFDMSVESIRSSLRGNNPQKTKSLKVNFNESQGEVPLTPPSTKSPQSLSATLSPPGYQPSPPPGQGLVTSPWSPGQSGQGEDGAQGLEGEGLPSILSHSGNHMDRAAVFSPLSPKSLNCTTQEVVIAGNGERETGNSQKENHIVLDGSLSPPCETSM